ncbi:glycosyltransferase [Streptomyces sp. NPDC051636]|uniref:glycosyltransferase n=1 Tax=Streptomyces sp. NPDC051636 TaxID=3365663 RepID=UPI0037BC00B6
MRPRLAWYTQEVLAPTQTFVADQLVATEATMGAKLFGVDLMPGIEVPGPTWVMGRDCVFGSVEAVMWKAMRRSPRLRSALKNFEPDVLIAHCLHYAWRVSRLTESLGVPLVAMCHGSDVLTIRGRHHRPRSMRQLSRNWARLVGKVRLFLPVSRFLGDRLVALGVPPSRVVVHHLGVALPDRYRLGSAGDRAGVLFVGSLIENKGCDFLVRAVGRLAREGRRVSVTVVGDGPQRGALQRQAAELPSGASVRFLGTLPHAAVLSLMRQHRLLCAPSVEVASGAGEGLSLVACEAAARGRPVVAFDTGGLSEVVCHGETGLMVPPRSVEGLADALGMVLADDSMAHTMGQAARKRAEQRFDLFVQAGRLREVLTQHGLMSAAEDMREAPQRESTGRPTLKTKS